MLTKVVTQAEKPQEGPNVESLRWLGMVLIALEMRGQPITLNGARIKWSRVAVSQYAANGTLIPDRGWEHTGHVYAYAELTDGVVKEWRFPVGMVNNRDTKKVLREIAGQEQVDILIQSNNIIQAIH